MAEAPYLAYKEAMAVGVYYHTLYKCGVSCFLPGYSILNFMKQTDLHIDQGGWHMIISGTVSGAVQLMALNNKWQQKKESGEVLSRDEVNERATWTKEDWLKHDIEEQAAQNRETSTRTGIDNKILAGGALTPEEEKYLERESPATLQKYKEVKAEKKAYEEQLKQCKTKDDVQRLKTETLGEYAASMKKVENDPYIPMSEKLAKAQELLAKTRNVQEVELKFIQSPAYDRLPTEAEEAKERSEEREQEQEQILETSKETDTDTNDDADVSQEIEDAYQRIQLHVQLDDDGDADTRSDSERKVGEQIDIVV
jgi:hypothetical protein